MKAALAALLAAACASRPPCPTPKLAGPVDPRPFLWEVQGPSAKVYLFGTFHAAGRGDVPPAALARARATRTFVAEIPPLDPEKVRPLMMLPKGQSLAKLIGDDAWYDLRDALYGMISEGELRRARPWYAMSLLTSASTDHPAQSMDSALEEAAELAGARLEYLETPEAQLAALGESVTPEDLKQALAERKQMRCAVSDLIVAYRRGDGDAIRGEISGDAEAKLIDERNQRWLDQIDEYLNEDGAFVAVGVSHLIGERGLPALLEARGHKVTRLAGM